MAKMTNKEITQFVEYYIGVDQYGGLRGVRDASHLREFYYVDCDLEINPQDSITTADEFERVLRSLPPQYQARVLRAGLEEFYVYSDYDPITAQDKLRPRLENVADRLESETTLIENVSPRSPSETVRLALEEAEDLIRRRKVSSAIDRTHTALHTYIKDSCDEWLNPIQYEKDASLTKVFKVLQKNHPAFNENVPRQQDIEKMMNGLATILESLNPIRNRASLAHRPDTSLLDEVEATLAVNAARSIFHYVEAKIQHLFDDMDQIQNLSAFDNGSMLTIDDIPF